MQSINSNMEKKAKMSIKKTKEKINGQWIAKQSWRMWEWSLLRAQTNKDHHRGHLQWNLVSNPTYRKLNTSPIQYHLERCKRQKLDKCNFNTLYLVGQKKTLLPRETYFFFTWGMLLSLGICLRGFLHVRIIFAWLDRLWRSNHFLKK